MKHYPIQTNFTAGEISPKLYGRVDIDRYGNGCAILKNFCIMPQGGAYRRPGTGMVVEVKDSSKKTRIKRFVFSTEQAYIIEFGDLYLRFCKDHGQIVSGPSAYEIVAPWALAELFDLSFTQSADVLYVAGSGRRPKKVSRTGHTAWTITDVDFQDGPYLTQNTTATTITPSATTGSVTLTASTAIFASTDIGRWVRIKHGSTWGCAQITAFGTSTSVTATVTKAFGATTAQTGWRLGAWSDTTGWPRCVTFYQQRLVFGNTTTQPQTFWMSESGDFNSFAPSNTDSTVVDSNGITYTILSSQVNAIMWMQGSSRGLQIGTAEGEWLITSASNTKVIAPDSAQAFQKTNMGSRNVPQSQASYSTIYVHRSGRKVFEFYYDYTVDTETSKDLAILSEHLLRDGGGVVGMAFQQQPDSIFWMIRDDGMLVGMTFLKEQSVVGFHWHELGGSFGSGAPVVESIDCIPTPDGASDELWLVVKRTIDGQTKRYIEYLTQPFEAADANDKNGMFFVDSGISYNGVPETVFSGLDHLEGETVAICADGAVRPDAVVTGGEVTLTREASVVHIGLPYESKMRTLRPEGGGNAGTAQGKVKRYGEASIRLFQSLFLKYGRDENNLKPLPFRSTGDPMGDSPALFSGDKDLPIDDKYTTEGWFWIAQDKPYPLTILAIMPKGVVYE
jgi:hypothetical protein